MDSALLVRQNHQTEIRGLPKDLLWKFGRHLAIPAEPGAKRGARFSHFFRHGDELWGSLLHGNRVAAGLTPHLQQLCTHYGVPYQVQDCRQRPEDQIPWWSMRMSWRPYQDVVHAAICREGVGIIDALPRSGKTAMAARAVDTLALPTIYLAPSLAIVRQTFDRFIDWFGTDMVARLDGESKDQDISKPIVIGTAASAVKQPQEWWNTRKVLISDEFHHGAAATYHEINLKTPHIYYRLGFTGTHFRSKDDTLAMEAICSTVLARVPIDELIAGGWLATPRIVYVPFRGKRAHGGETWQSVYCNGVVDHDGRNRVVAHIARTLAFESQIPTIVLTRRRKHADLLGGMIPDAVVVKGGESALTNDRIEAFRKGQIPVIVGTTVIGEGIDVPTAGAVVYASGGNGTVEMIQSYFRPLTGHPGKPVGLVYDFVDHHHRMLKRHSLNRVQFTRNLLNRFVVEL